MKKSFLIIFSLLCNIVYAGDGKLVSVEPTITYGYHGSITFTPNPYEANTTFTLTAVADEANGYSFLKWADGNTDNPRTVTPLSSVSEDKLDLVLKAIFVRKEDVNFAEGTVSISGVSHTDDEEKMEYELTFTPIGYNSFTQWSNEETELTTAYVPQDGKVIPIFGNNLESQIVDGGCGTIELSVAEGGGYQLTAIPDDGYYLVGWEDESTDNPRAVGHDIDKTYTAHFALIPEGAIQGQNGSYPTIADALTANEDNLSLTANITEDVVLTEGQELTFQTGAFALNGDITVQSGATLNLAGATTVNNLYLNATTGKSAQLTGEANLTGQVWADIQLESENTTASDDKWYAISVPFNVDINEGVYHNDGTKATNINDYLAWEYDGTLRASCTGEGGNGWKKMNNGSMTAGRFYMFGINGNNNVWRFKKTGDYGTASVALAEFPGDQYNKGWNAVGNSTLVYSKAAITGIDYAQVYDNNDATGKYMPVELISTTFVMACPFFVQTAGDNTMTFTANNESDAALRFAPKAENDPACELRLISEIGKLEDVLFLTTSENAEAQYVIGKDVAKIISGNNHSYIWANGYGQRLCAQDTRLEDGIAAYSVSVYAPAEATYTIHALPRATNEVWLMQGSLLLANLSEGDYTLYLNKGTTEYTIMLGQPAGAPTSLMQGSQCTMQSYKVLRNNRLMIIVNNRIYDAQGQEVK